MACEQKIGVVDRPGAGPGAERLSQPAAVTLPAGLQVAVLTGGYDKPYVFGFTHALAARNIQMEVVGGDDIDCPEMRALPQLRFLNLIGARAATAGPAAKVARVIAYYARLMRYALSARPKIFHILWNNKFERFDRTFLTLYYKLLGKKLVLTAHNVNAGKRDGNDSRLNRLTLRMQYRLADHIFVHTEKMKDELTGDFAVSQDRVSVIPFGINNSVPDTELTGTEARRLLGIPDRARTILFFGALRPYKGLEYLVDAFFQLAGRDPDCRLVIAGQRRKESGDYPEEVLRRIDSSGYGDRVLQAIRFIPDEEAEIYFKAADVVALPYTHVFQSGVLFLSYSFGLPVVATDVGSIRDEIVEGETGLLCAPCDSAGLAAALEAYFAGDLYRSLSGRRRAIREWAAARHSWSVVSESTSRVYAELLA